MLIQNTKTISKKKAIFLKKILKKFQLKEIIWMSLNKRKWGRKDLLQTLGIIG